jgi:hypothetical protein
MRLIFLFEKFTEYVQKTCGGHIHCWMWLSTAVPNEWDVVSVQIKRWARLPLQQPVPDVSLGVIPQGKGCLRGCRRVRV